MFLFIQSLDIIWSPRVDGNFVPDAPHKLVSEGRIANVPFVAGVSQLSHVYSS